MSTACCRNASGVLHVLLIVCEQKRLHCVTENIIYLC